MTSVNPDELPSVDSLALARQRVHEAGGPTLPELIERLHPLAALPEISGAVPFPSDSVRVLAVQSHPILALKVTAPKRTAAVAAATGQSPLESFHITLARLDDKGITFPHEVVLPPPPAALALNETVYQVLGNDSKHSCFQALTVASQDALVAYVKALERLTGLSLLEPHRIYHVSLTNAGAGKLRASVGNVWEFDPQPLVV